MDHELLSKRHRWRKDHQKEYGTKSFHATLSYELTTCILHFMGLFLAIGICASWIIHLVYVLSHCVVDAASPMTYLHIAVQAYLSTGLFITAHDAIHGTVAPHHPRVNTVVGSIASFLYAGLWYPRLVVNHHLHHAHPADDHDDPDYHQSNNLVVWYLTFMWRYATVWQIVVMGTAYNILNLWVPAVSLWWFWIVPAFMGSFQLFYFGTYRPHRKPHTQGMPHNARSQSANHLWALISCYFFGYHTEHHVSPGTPWWQLWKVKDNGIS